MSNVIKAYSIHYNGDLKKTIDNRLKEAQSESVIPAQKKLDMAVNDNGEFVQGLQAVVVDMPDEEEIKGKSIKIIEDARKESKSILENAKAEAEAIKNETLASAKKKGYEDGFKQGLLETEKKMREYDDLIKKQQKEFDAAITGLEPEIADIIAGLIERITGILVEDKKDVILYLVEKTFKKLDKASEFTIRVSKDDYECVSSNKDHLIDMAGRKIQLNIIEDPVLTKNQCLIETDIRIINCSLDVQLANLAADLKLLGGI